MPLTERDIKFEEYNIHMWEGGKGFPILMLHGSGPGAGSMANWHYVIEPLTECYRVVAADLIGFGKSSCKLEEPYFDISLWRRQAKFLFDHVIDNEGGLIGHSLSASLVLDLAMNNPRVTKVLTTGAMGAKFLANRFTRMCWTFPETREELRQVIESLVYDKSIVTNELLDARMKILHDGIYGPYFKSMFQGDKQRYIDTAVLSEELLKKLSCDVVLMHGRNDLPFPYRENSLALSRSIPHADINLVGNCGHSPALEHPNKFLNAAKMLFD